MKLKSRKNNAISFIQITDTHLFEDSKSTFGDIVSEQSLSEVLDLAKASKHWPSDFILATGDLAQEPTAITYAKFHSMTNNLETPVFCLPGNHDDPQLMGQQLNSGNLSTEKEIIIGNWCILLLDSFKPNTHAGELSMDEFIWLKDRLLEHQNKHVLIALHHHPVSIHSSWMDSMMLENADDFLAVVEKNNNIRAIIWGHIHQAFHEQHKNIHYIGSPSTCAQFEPGATQYARDEKTAGFRHVSLYQNGEIQTSISRLKI